MPANTFYHLPAPKRNRLIRAAWQEFSQYSFADSSINRIVQSAGIPRGSFYQYFCDKHDLFSHITTVFSAQFSTLLSAAMKRFDNHLGAALLSVFDYWFLHQSAPSATQYQQICLLKRNPDMDWLVFIRPKQQARLLVEEMFRMEEDMIAPENIIYLQLSVFIVSCKQTFFRPDSLQETRASMSQIFQRLFPAPT